MLPVFFHTFNVTIQGAVKPAYGAGNTLVQFLAPSEKPDPSTTQTTGEIGHGE
jgi:hypothetical protein